MRFLLAAAVCSAAAAGCVGELSAEAPCSAQRECLIGFECVESFCIACPDGACGGLVNEVIGPDQSTLCGPDQACISVPDGALAGPTELYIRRSGASVPANLEARSLVYELGPASVVLQRPAAIRIPISPSNPVDDIFIYRASVIDGTWTRIEASVPAIDGQYIDAETADLGFFVAARSR